MNFTQHIISIMEHFATIFAWEPMTLPESDHVPFFPEHAQTFFAGEGICGNKNVEYAQF